MENSQEDERFSFGSVANSQYVQYEIIDTTTKLPYNPFQFDLKLTVYKIQINSKQVGTEYPLSRLKTSVFGRKKKTQQEWEDENSIPVYLNTQRISGKHFSINEQYIIRDLGSKNGTFIWVDREHPRKIQPLDTYLIAQGHLVINRVIHLPKPMIQMTYLDKTIKISDNKKLFLIGSHEKCDLIIPSLYHFEVCINVTNFTIFTHLDEEEADTEHGLWYKLREQKKEQTILQHGNLILTDPYIFRVTS